MIITCPHCNEKYDTNDFAEIGKISVAREKREHKFMSPAKNDLVTCGKCMKSSVFDDNLELTITIPKDRKPMKHKVYFLSN